MTALMGRRVAYKSSSTSLRQEFWVVAVSHLAADHSNDTGEILRVIHSAAGDGSGMRGKSGAQQRYIAKLVCTSARQKGVRQEHAPAEAIVVDHGHSGVNLVASGFVVQLVHSARFVLAVPCCSAEDLMRRCYLVLATVLRLEGPLWSPSDEGGGATCVAVHTQTLYLACSTPLAFYVFFRQRVYRLGVCPMYRLTHVRAYFFGA